MGSTVTPADQAKPAGASQPWGQMRALLDTLDRGVVVASRDGSVLMLNARARKCMTALNEQEATSLNIFNDFLLIDSQEISRRIDTGEHEIP